MSAAILAVLTVIENLISVLGTSSQTATMIDNIINALTQLLPLIVDEVSTVYNSVKNIISLLQNSGTMTADQQAALTSLDAQVDTAWNSVVNQIDPDNPANAGTPAGS
jgi:phage-related protein